MIIVFKACIIHFFFLALVVFSKPSFIFQVLKAQFSTFPQHFLVSYYQEKTTHLDIDRHKKKRLGKFLNAF
jgi:hypothetical protein